MRYAESMPASSSNASPLFDALASRRVEVRKRALLELEDTPPALRPQLIAPAGTAHAGWSALGLGARASVGAKVWPRHLFSRMLKDMDACTLGYTAPTSVLPDGGWLWLGTMSRLHKDWRESNNREDTYRYRAELGQAWGEDRIWSMALAQVSAPLPQASCRGSLAQQLREAWFQECRWTVHRAEKGDLDAKTKILQLLSHPNDAVKSPFRQVNSGCLIWGMVRSPSVWLLDEKDFPVLWTFQHDLRPRAHQSFPEFLRLLLAAGFEPTSEQAHRSAAHWQEENVEFAEEMAAFALAQDLKGALKPVALPARRRRM